VVYVLAVFLLDVFIVFDEDGERLWSTNEPMEEKLV
jgi:hypothetical protein